MIWYIYIYIYCGHTTYIDLNMYSGNALKSETPSSPTCIKCGTGWALASPHRSPWRLWRLKFISHNRGMAKMATCWIPMSWILTSTKWSCGSKMLTWQKNPLPFRHTPTSWLKWKSLSRRRGHLTSRRRPKTLGSRPWPETSVINDSICFYGSVEMDHQAGTSNTRVSRNFFCICGAELVLEINAWIPSFIYSYCGKTWQKMQSQWPREICQDFWD